MCGRYAFYDPKEIFEIRMILEEIAQVFDAKTVDSIKQGEVFPSETAAVLAQSPKGFRPYPMEWGYTIDGLARRVINARTETVHQKPMFRGSLSAQKCAIPCTGFYEWQKTEGKSIKHLVGLQGAPFFYLGGLYNRFRIADQWVTRFVILTTAANDQMQPIHHRMPLIIPPEQKEQWLLQSQAIPALISSIEKAPKHLDLTAL